MCMFESIIARTQKVAGICILYETFLIEHCIAAFRSIHKPLALGSNSAVCMPCASSNKWDNNVHCRLFACLLAALTSYSQFTCNARYIVQ
jgi:hypothetical protein